MLAHVQNREHESASRASRAGRDRRHADRVDSRIPNLKEKSGGGAGRIPPSDVGFDRPRSVSDGSLVGDGGDITNTSEVLSGVDLSAGRNVENRLIAVREKLFNALGPWTIARDAPTLRRNLLEILSALD
jgi:hypothetical protein